MATKRGAKRVTSRATQIKRDNQQEKPGRTAESLGEIAMASGAQAVQFAAAVARGMVKGVASAARQLRKPVGEVVERPTKARRRPASTRGRKLGSAKRRAA